MTGRAIARVNLLCTQGVRGSNPLVSTNQRSCSARVSAIPLLPTKPGNPTDCSQTVANRGVRPRPSGRRAKKPRSARGLDGPARGEARYA